MGYVYSIKYDKFGQCVASRIGRGRLYGLSNPVVDPEGKWNEMKVRVGGGWKPRCFCREETAPKRSRSLGEIAAPDPNQGEPGELPPCSENEYRVYFNTELRLLHEYRYIHHDEKETYFYHPDHLGSSSWITDQNGDAIQHLQYLPFGEPYVDQRTTGWNAMFTFSGKERDEETGYSYFGARYYDSDLSIWLSVDPLADKYPHQSNYVYCSNNPLRIIDPDGMDEWEINRKGEVTWKCESEKHTLYAVDKKGNRTGNSLTLKDRDIFDDLASSGKESGYKNSRSSGGENSQEAMLKTFKFAADNTDAEWRVDRFSNNGTSNYSVGTIHNERLAPTAEHMGHSSFSVIAFIHSHPGTGLNWEIGSMGFHKRSEGSSYYKRNTDVDYKTNVAGYNNCLYYTYFPKSGNLYNVRSGNSPAFIRNVRNYKGFMFGTINTQ